MSFIYKVLNVLECYKWSSLSNVIDIGLTLLQSKVALEITLTPATLKYFFKCCYHVLRVCYLWHLIYFIDILLHIRFSLHPGEVGPAGFFHRVMNELMNE